MCVIRPRSFRVIGKSRASTNAKQLAKVPAALVPKPDPMGTLTLKSMWTSKVAAASFKISVMADRVVCASGAGFELMRMLRRDLDAFLVDTLAVAPLGIANPPPLAPIRAGSMIEFPAASVSHTSKKLEMPAGHVASEAGNEYVPLFLRRISNEAAETRKGCPTCRDDGRCEYDHERNLRKIG